MLTLWSIVCAVAFCGLILAPALYIRCRWYRRECDLLSASVDGWIAVANKHADELNKIRNGEDGVCRQIETLEKELEDSKTERERLQRQLGDEQQKTFAALPVLQVIERFQTTNGQSLLEVAQGIGPRFAKMENRISELVRERDQANARAEELINTLEEELVKAEKLKDALIVQRDDAARSWKEVQDAADQKALEAAAEIGRLLSENERLKTELQWDCDAHKKLQSENVRLAAKVAELRDWIEKKYSRVTTSSREYLCELRREIDALFADQPTEYEAGRQAFRDGRHKYLSPFITDQDRRELWCAGWEFEASRNEETEGSDVEQEAAR